MSGLFDLSGRHALVTGAAGYLGAAFSSALAEAGAHVLLGGRTAAPLEALAARIRETGGRATAVELDVTDIGGSSRLRQEIAATGGRLDILISNAHAGRSSALEDVGAADFARAAGQSAGAMHELIVMLRPFLRREPHEQPSSVIGIASMYATVSPDPRAYETAALQNPADYGAAKAGLVQYARHAAVHFAAEGIRVNTISPGPFPRTDSADPAFVARLASRVPLGRVGRPEELATAALFLASPASSYVTGIDVPVDGGWTAW